MDFTYALIICIAIQGSSNCTQHQISIHSNLPDCMAQAKVAERLYPQAETIWCENLNYGLNNPVVPNFGVR